MTKRKIVVLTANPLDTSRLRLGKEVAEIQEELQRANLRDRFEFVFHWAAVRPKDIQRVLLDVDPHIVHFAGHGGDGDGLIFENEAGEHQFVSTKAPSQLHSSYLLNRLSALCSMLAIRIPRQRRFTSTLTMW